MNASTKNHERAGIGAILCVAMLMFFAPLISLHGALAGDESANGMSLNARLSSLRSSIDITNLAFAQGRGGSTGSADEHPMASVPIDVPQSLKFEWVASLLIFAAEVCAALALIAMFVARKAGGPFSLAGGFFGALAILQLFVLNTGVRLWTSQLIESGMLGSPQDPFVAMRMLMARSFQLDPGIGLYVLTSCLFLASALSFTSAIPRMASVVRRSPRVQISVPIRVRPVDPQYPEEISTTLDVSEHGIYFVSERKHYYAGMELRVRRNPQLGDMASSEERASVVRVRSLEPGKYGVAVRLISPASLGRTH